MASLFAPVQLSIADQEAMTACTAYLTSADVSIAAAAASTLHQLYSAFDPPAISVLHHPYVRQASPSIAAWLPAQQGVALCKTATVHGRRLSHQVSAFYMI